MSKLLSSGSTSVADERGFSQRFSSLSYVPAPVPVVQAASAGNTSWMQANPQYGYENIGELTHLDDAVAAYTHAVAYAATGNVAYADKAIEIMNAWSAVLTEIKFDQPRRPDNNWQVYNNGKLQAGWAGSLNARAAEIIRYTSDRWSSADVARYETMLRDVYLPLVISSWPNCANCMMTYVDTTMAIGVFLDDRGVFETAVDQWRTLLPSTVYMTSDGPNPVPPSSQYTTPSQLSSYWYSPSSYIDGLHGETGRDLSHVMMGMGASADAAQTAYLQGVDLFAEQQARLVAAYELHAGWVNEYLDEKERLGGSEPSSSWRPTGWVNPNFANGGGAYKMGWEVAYGHYAFAKGVSMPETARLVERMRPSGSGLHLSWETLSSARDASSPTTTTTTTTPPTSTTTTTTTTPGGSTVASDSFSRSTSNGLGSADVGGAWSTSGSPSDFSVADGAARIRVPSPAVSRAASLTSVSARDAEMSMTLSADQPPTGGGLYLTQKLRVAGASDYRMVLRLETTQTRVQLRRVVDGADALLAETALPTVYSAGTQVHFRFQAVGTGTTSLAAKAWFGSSEEPQSWQVEATDSAGPQASGSVGTLCYVSGSATNTPTVLSIDQLTVSGI